ncbi:MAG: hypothetical protein EXR99_11605 [Gemmataceae bacterium]|nr:hypothetical protein [Gemmataceae bacterium]
MAVESQAAVLPELVLLLREPLVFEKSFLQGAVVAAFRRVLPTDEPDAEEFVIGDYPIFFVGLQGNLLQVKSMPVPYNAQSALPFVQGDPNDLLSGIADPEFRKLVARHKGWVSAALMKPGPEVHAKPFKLVSKMLSAFGFEDVCAIICPGRQQILPWDFAMHEKLSHGRGLNLFHGQSS